MIKRGRSRNENSALKGLVMMIMILALLFAGSDIANSQEGHFSDPFHLGNIQELGIDVDSQINLLEDDRRKILFFIKSFQERGLDQALKKARGRLDFIEKELAFLSKRKE